MSAHRTPRSAAIREDHDAETERPSAAARSGLERGRGAGRRLSVARRAAEDGEMTREQMLFIVAIDEFKRANGVRWPSWTDVLEVVRLLGYRKTLPSELDLPRAEDWRERPNAPANVRPDNWERRFGDEPFSIDDVDDDSADDGRSSARRAA